MSAPVLAEIGSLKNISNAKVGEIIEVAGNYNKDTFTVGGATFLKEGLMETDTSKFNASDWRKFVFWQENGIDVSAFPTPYSKRGYIEYDGNGTFVMSSYNSTSESYDFYASYDDGVTSSLVLSNVEVYGNRYHISHSNGVWAIIFTKISPYKTGIYISTDGASTFNLQDTSSFTIDNTYQLYDFARSGNTYVVTGSRSASVYITYDAGGTWTEKSIGSQDIGSVIAYGQGKFAVSSRDNYILYRSIDGGSTFEDISSLDSKLLFYTALADERVLAYEWASDKLKLLDFDSNTSEGISLSGEHSVVHTAVNKAPDYSYYEDSTDTFVSGQMRVLNLTDDINRDTVYFPYTPVRNNAVFINRSGVIFSPSGHTLNEFSAGIYNRWRTTTNSDMNTVLFADRYVRIK